MSSDAAPPLANGRYRLLQQLGAGGMAIVYRAYDSRLDVERAIKVLNPRLASSAQIIKRFENEARTMAKLHHPNIVTVHDVGHEGDRAYMVMELVLGGTLMDHLQHFGFMAEREACEAMTLVLQALAVAHDRGVVHRDIKPHNVLVDAKGTPRVTDFGIAHVPSATRSLTRTGAIMGTWAYMAPEQRADSKTVDARADIYGVGATLYYLVTGREPFDLHNTEAHEESFAGVPEALAGFIRKATRYRPSDRFADSRAAAAALLEVSATLPELDPDAPRLGDLPQAEPGSGHQTGLTLDALTPGPSTAGAYGGGVGTEVAATMQAERSQPTYTDPAADATLSSEAGGPTLVSEPTAPPPEAAPSGSSRTWLVGGAALVLAALVGATGISAWISSGPGEPIVETDTEEVVADEEPEADASAEVDPVRDDGTAEVEPEEPAGEPVAPPPPPKQKSTVRAKTVKQSTPPPPPIDPTPEVEEAGTAEPAEPIPEEAAVEPDPPPALPTGPVSINSVPSSRLSIDGEDRGGTPWEGTLTVGTHRVALTRDGKSTTRTIEVTEAGVRFCWDFRADAPCPKR